MQPATRPSDTIRFVREGLRLPDAGRVTASHSDIFRHEFPPHEHDTYAVCVNEYGLGEYELRRARRVVGTGALFVVPPGELHTGRSAAPEGWHYITLYLPESVFAALGREAGGSGRPPAFAPEALHDDDLAARIRGFAASLERPVAALGLESQLVALGAALLTRHARPGLPRGPLPDARPALARAREFLDHAAASAVDASLSQLSREAGLSRHHLLRAFREAYGLTPHAYLMQKRVVLARRLILEGCTLVEAAVMAGFCDQSHLSRQFKRHFGISPGRLARGG